MKLASGFIRYHSKLWSVIRSAVRGDGQKKITTTILEGMLGKRSGSNGGRESGGRMMGHSGELCGT